MEKFKSKTGTVSRAPYELYMSFVDMRNFTTMLPEDKRDMVEADYDSITVNYQGFCIGAKVQQRIPYSYIELVDWGNSPVPFKIGLNFGCKNLTAILHRPHHMVINVAHTCAVMNKIFFHTHSIS